MRKKTALAAALFCATHVAADPAFDKLLPPFIEKNCVSCHGPEKQKGKLRLDTLAPDFKDPLVVGKWEEVIDSISNHDMPPEDEPQPSTGEINAVAAYLEGQLSQAEIAQRSTRVILRRLNRSEYDNTIRDLIGTDFEPADDFPADPPAGGFDNIGAALTMSPMQLELYYSAAREILDRALVEGEKPEAIKWRFDPEEAVGKTADKYRVSRGESKSIIVNEGENEVKGDFTLIHHNSWNKSVNFRNFSLPADGQYIVRIRAAGFAPTRDDLLESVSGKLAEFRDEKIAKNAGQKKYADQEFERDMEHFRTSPYYDYGPPRMKLTKYLDGTPYPVDEVDVPGPAPGVREFRTRFTTGDAGFRVENTYVVPHKPENFRHKDHDYFARPQLAIDYIEIEGPILPAWPPESHTRILHDSPLRESDETAYAREVLARFMPRAYRRPVTNGEIDARLDLFKKLRPEKPSFVEAIKVPLAAILASPHFLFLVEPATPEPRPLNGFEMANRLSYFLWSSMPDETLFSLASSGEILKPAVIRAQTDRMLADPRSSAFVKNFAGQWLGLRKVGDNPPVQNLYPEYDRHLELSIIRESEGFFEEILREDMDARNLIRSNFVTINERLARYYGIPGVRGDEIRRVSVPPDSVRGGLVTQASIQSITSNGTRTSPVVRGTWILKTLLGTDPGLPVANVGEIQPDVPGIDKATVRQRLAIHRENPSCARCHDKIDPLGLALENFDAAGRWREQEGHGYNGSIGKNDPVIDASAKMPDGTEFVGVRGLQEQLLKKDDLFLNSLASQLTTYALGRELGFSDRAAIRSFVGEMRKNGNSIRSLIAAIATSDTFTTK